MDGLKVDEKISSTKIELQELKYTTQFENENSPLLKEPTKVYPRIIKIKWTRLFGCFSQSTISSQRVIRLNGSIQPPNHVFNGIDNTKYNFFSFIPVVLYNQFKFFYNFFYLAISLTQFVPILKVGFLFTYIAPLAFVLFLTMLKELYDDIQRGIKDKKLNNTQYKVLVNDNKISKFAKDLLVGDIIEINANERIPADILVLATRFNNLKFSEENASCFIKTDQLDGETDWKLRRSVKYSQVCLNHDHINTSVLENMEIIANAPSSNIYEFTGSMKLNVGDIDNSIHEPLSLENTMWANTTLTNGKVIGVILYTGIETRSLMNSEKATTKIGRFDKEVNTISKLLFAFMVVDGIIILFLKGFFHSWYISFFRYILLLSSILPISMRVNLDFAKTVFAFKINNDKELVGAIARNSNIPEELGRVEYFLTDKTGTLTKNEMIFKQLSIRDHIYYNTETKNEMKKAVKRVFAPNQEDKKKYKKQDDDLIRETFISIIVCNNVSTAFSDEGKSFQASSPDEIALVNYAEELGLNLLFKDPSIVKVKTPHDLLEFQVLAIFPFSSETKRMGIILRKKSDSKITFYLKGADSVMISKVKQVFRGFILDEVENLAQTGLRTLIFAKKDFSEEEFLEWKAIWDNANRTLVERSNEIKKSFEILEKDLDFIGITGVEDKLQDNVAGAIESISNAGIKIWILTGDKAETAKCIAVSAGLKSPRQEIFEIKDSNETLDIYQNLLEFSNKTNAVMLLEGSCFDKIIVDHQTFFFEVASKADGVIFYRCLPTQKAKISSLLRVNTKKCVLCIGDGGNDVGMIQQSDVGVGVQGKEGMQAALASDFSIVEFQQIVPLLLWHGRNSYKRSSKLTHFVIHRGLIISIIQMIFCIIFYFVEIPIFNGMLMLGYTTFFTSFPVFTLVQFVHKTDIRRRYFKGKSFSISSPV